MKTCVVSAFFLFMSLTRAAQGLSQAVLRRTGGGGYFKIGYGTASAEGIGKVLRSRSRFASDAVVVGGGGFSYLNRVIIGGNGFAMLGDSRGDTSVVHGGGAFEFGYDLLNRPKRQLLATLWFGGRGTSVEVKNGSEWNTGSLLAGGNLHFLNYVFFAPRNANETGGIHFGLRLSAWTSFASSPWERDGRRLAGADKYRPQGLMLTVTFGGGGFSNKNAHSP